MKTFPCGCVADSDGEFDRSETCPLHLTWQEAARRTRVLRDWLIENPLLEVDENLEEIVDQLSGTQAAMLDLSVAEEDEEPDGEDERKERKAR